MLARGNGVIAGVASVAGYRGIAKSEAYGATKAGQINLLEGLRSQLVGSGVHITTICPGFVRTPMTQGNHFPMPFLVEAEDAARAICDGLERDRNEIVFPARRGYEGSPPRASQPLAESMAPFILGCPSARARARCGLVDSGGAGDIRSPMAT